MKKFYKRVNAKHFTIENMLSCYILCHANCVYCTAACGTNVTTAAALIGTPAVNGQLDIQLVAKGSVVG